MVITKEQLQFIAPGIKPTNADLYPNLYNKWMPVYQINTVPRVTAFLANLAHESASFNATLEFDSGARYEGNTVLGNNVPGDGARFKGRAHMQITGRSMYLGCSHALFNDDRLIMHPELLEDPETGVRASCWFWAVVKGLNVVASQPDDYTHTFKGVTYNRFEWICFKINGGTNGMAQRKEFYARAVQVIK